MCMRCMALRCTCMPMHALLPPLWKYPNELTSTAMPRKIGVSSPFHLRMPTPVSFMAQPQCPSSPLQRVRPACVDCDVCVRHPVQVQDVLTPQTQTLECRLQIISHSFILIASHHDALPAPAPGVADCGRVRVAVAAGHRCWCVHCCSTRMSTHGACMPLIHPLKRCPCTCALLLQWGIVHDPQTPAPSPPRKPRRAGGRHACRHSTPLPVCVHTRTLRATPLHPPHTHRRP
jgi:hypothetical protein